MSLKKAWSKMGGYSLIKGRAPGAKAQRRKTAKTCYKRANGSFLWELVYKSHTQKIGGKVKQRWGCGSDGRSMHLLTTRWVNLETWIRQAIVGRWSGSFYPTIAAANWLISSVNESFSAVQEWQVTPYSITIDCGSGEITVMAYKPNLTSVYLTSLRENRNATFRKF